MLRALECRFCIIGHSECRDRFGETNADVSRKADALLADFITPIICVGESLDERDRGSDASIGFVRHQVEYALDDVKGHIASGKDVVFAYEPKWAIGTGLAATPEQAQEMCAAIRSMVASQLGDMPAEAIRILYSGSLATENIALFAIQPDIDGGLVGRASLDANSFVSVVKAFVR
jgi:triosephosphate isomerase